MKAILLITLVTVLIACDNTSYQDSQVSNPCDRIEPFYSCLYTEVENLGFPNLEQDQQAFKDASENCQDAVGIQKTSDNNNNSLNNAFMGAQLLKSCIRDINPYSPDAIVWTELLFCLKEKSKNICYSNINTGDHRA